LAAIERAIPVERSGCGLEGLVDFDGGRFVKRRRKGATIGR